MPVNDWTEISTFSADGSQLRSMAAVRYIGSKARVSRKILDLVGEPGPEDGVFVDAFCGTGVVAEGAADRGWPVRLNDHLRCATVIARARLLAPDDVPFNGLGSYEAAIAHLNIVPSEDGFFWREYSPASAAGRMYFVDENARRIDGVRRQIKDWERSAAITEVERDLLIADLIAAANRVANIAGTYGCYLSNWTANAKRSFQLETRELRSRPVQHTVSSLDVLDVPIGRADIVYFDPPYTKRQYAAYYHILETLAWGDEPKITGKTGLRPWRDKASDYCYKARALSALTSLIRDAPARRILLSYSNEGHVALDDLVPGLDALGELRVHEIASIGRYRPNQEASAAGDEVIEYVLELKKETLPIEEQVAA